MNYWANLPGEMGEHTGQIIGLTNRANLVNEHAPVHVIRITVSITKFKFDLDFANFYTN